MHILLLGSTILAPALRAQGHRVFSAGLGSGLDLTVEHPLTAQALLASAREQGFEPEVFLYMDNGNLPLLLDPEAMPCCSFWYSVDTYCNPWHIPYGWGFDHILCAQKDFLPLFTAESMTATWFPLFCAWPGPALDFAERDIPVAFVGTLGHKNNPDRKPFLERFRKRQPLVMMQGDYVPVFKRAAIVLNQTAFSELNYRCFEVMGMGAALLMEQCNNGLTDIFTPAENILPPYPRNDAEAAARIAACYLAQPHDLARIAQAGYELVLREHTDTVRAAQWLALATALAAKEPQAARKQEAARRRVFVHTAFNIIASELQGPQWEAYRRFFLRAGAL